MPADIAESINSLSEKILGNSVVSKIAKNPLLTSVVISFVIVLIIMFTFRNAQMDSDSGSLWTTSLRAGVWILIATAAMVMLNNSAVTDKKIITTGGTEKYYPPAASPAGSPYSAPTLSSPAPTTYSPAPLPNQAPAFSSYFAPAASNNFEISPQGISGFRS